MKIRMTAVESVSINLSFRDNTDGEMYVFVCVLPETVQYWQVIRLHLRVQIWPYHFHALLWLQCRDLPVRLLG